MLPIQAAMAVNNAVTLYGRLPNGQESFFLYKIDPVTRAFTQAGFSDLPLADWTRDVRAGTLAYLPSDGTTSVYYLYNQAGQISQKQVGTTVGTS